MTARDQDYDATLDAVLDVIESCYTSVMAGHQLLGASVERWRWDEPIATLTWSEEDQSNKNVNARVVVVDSGADTADLEGNAWFDTDISGKGRIRYWHHVAVKPLPADSESAVFFKEIEAVFEKLRAWSQEKLAKEGRETPIPQHLTA